MKSRTRHQYYYCRHCMKRFDSYAMAEICFTLDMKILEYNERKLKSITNEEAIAIRSGSNNLL
jgi:hypothetical protein